KLHADELNVLFLDHANNVGLAVLHGCTLPSKNQNRARRTSEWHSTLALSVRMITENVCTVKKDFCIFLVFLKRKKCG
ncbi:MAG: hypothetical protein IKB09_07925, partial [Oscillospiraceae bacterium]|nr:hypothetical protein [Oscillospiraceae bacterium]